jgi:carbon storage regulator
MLVLTRKPDQGIMIGDAVEIQVLSVTGETVRLGITAPRDVNIFRHELYERMGNARGNDNDPRDQEWDGDQRAAVNRAI